MAAPPPGSEVDICNLALARIGEQPIAAIEGDDLPRAARIMAQHYPMTRQALLRAYVFNFSKRYTTLQCDADVTPDFGFSYAYKLPNDHLRLLGIGDVTINDDTPPDFYDISGRHLFTDEGGGEAINVYDIKDELVVGKWDPLFRKLMYLELARDVSYAFTLKPSLLTQLDEQLKDVRLQAAAVAGQEKPPRRITRSKYINDRRMGGGSRDTTRHSV